MAITFERQISTFISDYFAEKAAANSRSYQSELACEIVLNNASVLSYATKTLTIDSLSQGTSSVGVASMNFDGRFSGTPDLRHSLGRSPDAGTFEVANLDYIISSAIPNTEKIFDNTFVTVYLCIPKPNGNYEGLIYFVGLLRDLAGDDMEAALGIVSDMSHKGAMLGKEITQRCLNSLGDDWCGVNHLPPGATCSKLWADKVNGCGYWGGVFNGVPFINPNGLLTGNVYQGVGGTGWEPYCPDVATTWFESANGGDIHARDMREGEVILNPLGNPVIVTAAEQIMAEYRYAVKTSVGAALIISASHHFLRGVDDETGYPAVEWYGNKSFPLLTKTRTHGLRLAERDEMGNNEYQFALASAGPVLRISTSDPSTYTAGMERGKYLCNHNQKSHYNWNPVG